MGHPWHGPGMLVLVCRLRCRLAEMVGCRADGAPSTAVQIPPFSHKNCLAPGRIFSKTTAEGVGVAVAECLPVGCRLSWMNRGGLGVSGARLTDHHLKHADTATSTVPALGGLA